VKRSSGYRPLANISKRAIPAVTTKRAPFSFSAETRADLERILGQKPELISRLERQVAPGGFVTGPIFDRMRKRTVAKTGQWRSLARALERLQSSLASLDHDAAMDLETGFDGLWEFEHNREIPDVDLDDFAAHATRISGILGWLLSRNENSRLRGRPRGISRDREFLGLSVALAVRQAGVKLTRGRDGILARTLEVLFDVAKLGAPEDMFDCVRSVVQHVEALDRRRQGGAEKERAKEVVLNFLEGIAMRSEKAARSVSPETTREARAKPPVD
jgi:hypothetical protein